MISFGKLQAQFLEKVLLKDSTTIYIGSWIIEQITKIHRFEKKLLSLSGGIQRHRKIVREY